MSGEYYMLFLDPGLNEALGEISSEKGYAMLVVASSGWYRKPSPYQESTLPYIRSRVPSDTRGLWIRVCLAGTSFRNCRRQDRLVYTDKKQLTGCYPMHGSPLTAI
jgi:hypothetical protein